jgi:hypothetical protein
MPDQPRKLPALGFAGFEDSSAAGGHSRRRRWFPIHTTETPGERQAADVSRFVDRAALCKGLGRRPDGGE